MALKDYAVVPSFKEHVLNDIIGNNITYAGRYQRNPFTEPGESHVEDMSVGNINASDRGIPSDHGAAPDCDVMSAVFNEHTEIGKDSERVTAQIELDAALQNQSRETTTLRAR